jgi:ferric-dicitrate binding protein FerR (iron transport regulator)
VVELNGNSKIAYQADWQENKVREVWLEGEGFFSVQHLKSHQKFIVHTQKKFAIEVLGTQFNVFARPSGTQVMLRSGKIRLDIPEAKSIVMKPGELIQFQDKPAAYTKAVVDPAVYSAWKENKFSLNNTSLKQILTRLEETYGVKVQVSNPNLLRLKGSGTMPADNLETLLQVIAETFELKVNQENPDYILLEPADTLE